MVSTPPESRSAGAVDSGSTPDASTIFGLMGCFGSYLPIMPYKDAEEKRRYQREYQRVWYEQNKDRVLAANQRYRKKKQKWFHDLKSQLACLKCGENHPACLDFHHRDPSSKDGDIGGAWRLWTRERILSEIAKCDVLCANCHRKEHAGS